MLYAYCGRPAPPFGKEVLMMYDAVIVGGGAVGCAVARWLSRYRLRICLVERG